MKTTQFSQPERTQKNIGPLMLDVEGLSLTPAEKALLSNPLVGGLILFSRNFESIDQLRALVGEIRRASPDIIIAVDHEGGRVQRFRDGFTRIPAMATLGDLYLSSPEEALEKAKDLGWILAAELISHDIDLSFAPVLDRNQGISSVIGDRAFSEDAQTIIQLSRAFIDGMHEAGMVSTGKHFPGHGGVAADSHLEIPVDPRSLSTLRDDDMRIFAALSANESGDQADSAVMDAVMPAHVIYTSVDSQPAGFSKIWLQDILRNGLGFDGVIFSDDLSMEGASVAGSFADRAQAALEAGCDMVLVCNHPEGAREVLAFLEERQDSGLFPKDNKRLARMRLDAQKQLTPNAVKLDSRWRKYNLRAEH